jgi:hypothetical protein
MRDIWFLGRRASERVQARKIYFAQRNDVENIRKMSEALQSGILVLQREESLITTLLQRGD